MPSWYLAGNERFAGPVVAAVSGRSYSHRSHAETTSMPNPWNSSLDIGTAASDRYIVVAIAGAAATTISSVVVNGVTLTQDILQNGPSLMAAIFSGLVTSGSGSQTVTVNSAGLAGQFVTLELWALNGLSVNAAHATVGVADPGYSSTISVAAGDLMFAAGVSGNTINYTPCTQSPAAIYNSFSSATWAAADWTIASTNASFTFDPQSSHSGSMDSVAVTYR